MNIDTFECQGKNYKHLLLPDEYIVTECDPVKIPCIIKTVKNVMPALLISGILAFSMWVFTLFVGFDTIKSSLATILGLIIPTVIFVGTLVATIIDAFGCRNVFYVITNKRIFFHSLSSEQKIKSIYYVNFSHVTVKTSIIDKIFHTGTIIIPYTANLSIKFHGVPDAHNISTKINSFCDSEYSKFDNSTFD
jgi:hypothetical protein